MKLLCLAVLLALGTANAGFFKDMQATLSGIGQAFAQTGAAFADAAKQSLSQIGANLLSQGSSLVGGALASLIKGPFGRRDLTAQNVLHGGQAFVNSLVDEFKHITSHGLDEINHLSQQFIDHPIEEVHQAIDQSVENHHAMLDTLMNIIPTTFEKQIGALMPHKKRALSDILSGIGSSLAEAFRPIKETGKQILSNVGNAAKTVAATFAGTLHDNLSQLGSKLTGHANAIKGHASQIVSHGTDALNALKDSVSDILAQTMTNIKPHLSGMTHEIAGAAGDTVGTLSG